MCVDMNVHCSKLFSNTYVKKRWNFMKFCKVNIANSSTTKIVFFPFFLPSSFLHPSLLSLSLFLSFFLSLFIVLYIYPYGFTIALKLIPFFHSSLILHIPTAALPLSPFSIFPTHSLSTRSTPHPFLLRKEQAFQW